MTREERKLTVEYLESMKEGYIEGEGYERHPLPEWYALDKAIEELEHEHCEDCVSRKSLKHKLQERHDFFVDAYGGFINLPKKDKARVDAIANCIAMVVNEPPVKPARKKGKWIIDDKENNRIWDCHCSECKKDPQGYIGGSEDWWVVRLPKYCPYCGSLMEGEE